MSKTIGDAIAEIEAKIQSLDAQARELKKQVNLLCQIEGVAETYPDAGGDCETAPKAKALRIRVDQFAGKKLARAAREYLEMRRAADADNAPAKIEDIHRALLDGGFSFGTTNGMQALSVSLGKSAHTFWKLNDGHFGLSEWYGKFRPKSKNGNGTEADDTEEAEESNVGSETEPVANPNNNGDNGEQVKVEMNPQ